MIRFQALKTFDEPDLRSTYVKGLFYTCKPDNHLLASYLSEWIEDGRAQVVVESEHMKSRVLGTGAIEE